MLIIGNISNLDFPVNTKEEMFQKCMMLLEIAAPGGHFVLANSGADIPLNTPPQTIHAMIQAAECYAQAVI